METLLAVLGSAQFWMGMSLIALAVPGPQTRVLPWLFRGIAVVLRLRSGAEGRP